MAKGTIKTKADRIEAEAIAHNAALDAGRIEADTAIIRAVNDVIAVQEAETKTRESKRQNIGLMLIEAGRLGLTRDNLKALFTSHPTWPKESNQPVAENKARGTAAGDAWNSVSATWGRYKMTAEGSPVVETVEGQPALVKLNKGKDKPETFGAGSPKAEEPVAPAFDVLSVITAIQDKLTPAQFDMIRPELEIVAAQFNQHIVKQAA